MSLDYGRGCERVRPHQIQQLLHGIGLSLWIAESSQQTSLSQRSCWHQQQCRGAARHPMCRDSSIREIRQLTMLQECARQNMKASCIWWSSLCCLWSSKGNQGCRMTPPPMTSSLLLPLLFSLVVCIGWWPKANLGCQPEVQAPATEGDNRSLGQARWRWGDPGWLALPPCFESFLVLFHCSVCVTVNLGAQLALPLCAQSQAALGRTTLGHTRSLWLVLV